MEFIIRLFS
uniref:Uncharacterized protein n=1 Tax=Rhizophora mucronata TaxID=61149 RepID=A0A2P2QUT4_RHIMU